ncbi:MAG: ComEC/Rec2 family competence protein [Spirochaetes bacterium]|nr:ComEC/Rec2 family competence protein [Spirochaetota bacterium]
MLWPYLFLVFVALTLFKNQHWVAAALTAACLFAFAATDIRRAPKKLLWAVGLGIALGAMLFALRLPHLAGKGDIPLSGEAEVVGVSRKSVIIQTAAKIKLRLTGLKKENLPARHARVAYRCEAQEVTASTFMIFERLSGVAAWCKTQDIRVLAAPAGFLSDFRKKILAYLHDRFDKMGERSLIAAFLLGDTEDLAPQELDAFRDMGLMHLFAVSGLNIALLFALLYLPFRFAGLPAVGSALGYAVATGFLLLLDFPVPLLRAWLFMTIALAMRVIDRRLPSWTLLFLTAIIVELLFPLSTFSMSFILSFGITGAILVFYEPLHFCFASKNKLLNLLGEHAALTLAAGLPALILGYLLFGSAHPLSLVYNLLLVPFSGLYLFLSLVFLIFEPVKYALHALDMLYLKFAGWHSAYVSASFPAAEATIQILSLVFVALLLAALYYLKRRRRLWSARRNLRYVMPVTAVVLVLPFLLAVYPAVAIYAVPNKVWIYSGKKIAVSGVQLFKDGKPAEPKTCFPVHGKSEWQSPTGAPEETLIMGNRCFIFTGRMKPENWPPDLLKACATLDVFQSKKLHTDAAEWDALFRLFGFQGKATVRKFFTWYGDKPATCIKEIL